MGKKVCWFFFQYIYKTSYIQNFYKKILLFFEACKNFRNADVLTINEKSVFLTLDKNNFDIAVA